ncbi:cyclophilin-like fold protein [Bacteroides pyogenes]|uniref:cyclophilin-like fold protein n=1 Tax=Bacteroides pyogenes TaxID=310300 RepID=UPI003FA1430F
MRLSYLISLTIVQLFVFSASSCSRNEEIVPPTNNNTHPPSDNAQTGEKERVKVGSKVFTVTLVDTNSAKAFRKMLPLEVNMIELNNNEKYCDLPNSLPTNSSNPQIIKSGDLMLYGSKTLVLFYKSFSTSYSYTKLGVIDDATGLEEALGKGNVIVKFESE